MTMDNGQKNTEPNEEAAPVPEPQQRPEDSGSTADTDSSAGEDAAAEQPTEQPTGAQALEQAADQAVEQALKQQAAPEAAAPTQGEAVDSESAESAAGASSEAQEGEAETPPEAGEKPAPASNSPDKTVDDEDVKKLAADAGISPEAALAIILGQTSLKRAQNNIRKRSALYLFAHEHKLPHSLAGQVIRKQMSLEEAQTRARVIEHRRHHRRRCSFTKAMKSEEPMIVGLHGQEELRAKVLENLKYDVKLLIKGEEQVIPKHNVKYMFHPDLRKLVRKQLKQDKELSKSPLGPITKVAQRFKLKDDVIQRVIDLETHLLVTLLEGERFAAEVKHYSQYEIVFNMRNEGEVTVFRHALKDAEIVPLEEVLAAERYAKKMQKKTAGKSSKGKKKKKKRR